MRAKWIATAIAVCGVLDIIYALGLALLKGGTIKGLLLGVAAGPFAAAPREWGVLGPAAGLATHFAIMTVMVLVYFQIGRLPAVRRLSPWLAGCVYGLGLYAVMYLIVLPLRWPALYPDLSATGMALAILPHVMLVGLPLAFIERKSHVEAMRPGQTRLGAEVIG